jgi:hypothetical protein
LVKDLLAFKIMSAPKLWKITCQEDAFPGLWQLWFKFQCVAVGYPPKWLRDIERKNTEEWKRRRTGWHQVENRLNEIQDRDLIVVALPGRRIGRLGEVIEKKVLDDQWKSLVPPSPEEDEGLLGRRILVRWELENGPDSSDMVVQLPEDFYLNPGEWRQPLARIHDKSAIEKFRKIMADPTNWVGLLGHFGYEQALSDYIALHPHRLEGGLLPHPNKRIREKVFKDRSRADVLLLDKESKPVIVECKQESPSVEDIHQLQHYLKRFRREERQQARGILVHGGAQKVHWKVAREAKKSPSLEIIQYKLDVNFAPSC